jgi:hypothetical protein
VLTVGLAGLAVIVVSGGVVSCSGGGVVPDTVTCTSSYDDIAPSVATSRSTYVPLTLKDADVSTAWAFPKVTSPGPDASIQIEEIEEPAGRPSSLTVPSRLTVAGRVTDESDPAFTVGGPLVGSGGGETSAASRTTAHRIESSEDDEINGSVLGPTVDGTRSATVSVTPSVEDRTSNRSVHPAGGVNDCDDGDVPSVAIPPMTISPTSVVVTDGVECDVLAVVLFEIAEASTSVAPE